MLETPETHPQLLIMLYISQIRLDHLPPKPPGGGGKPRPPCGAWNPGGAPNPAVMS